MARSTEELLQQVAQFDDYTPPATVIESNLIRIARELSAKLREREWQDISTAPKDGRDLLLYFTDDEIGSGHWTQVGFKECWFTGGGFCDEDSDYPATHWQPLPTPPKKED